MNGVISTSTVSSETFKYADLLGNKCGAISSVVYMDDTSHSDFEYSYEKRYRNRVFTIGVRVDPSINSIESWAVVLQFSLEDGTHVRVIQADNIEHDQGTIHLDCYYREIGRDVKDFDVDFGGPFEAETHIKDNFQRYVDYYVDTHGWAPRDDEKNC